MSLYARVIAWLNEELEQGEWHEPPLRRWAVLVVDLCGLIIAAEIITIILIG